MFKVPQNSRSRYFIYDYVVRVKTANKDYSDQWYCLATSESSEVIRVSKNTSNAPNHLAKVHGVTSQRSLNLMNRKRVLKTKLSKESQLILKSNPNRFNEVKFVKLIVRKMLPFNFGESLEVRSFIHMLDQRSEFRNQMHARKFMKKIFMMCKCSVGSISRGVHEVMSHNPLPMLQLNLDLWTCRGSSKKQDLGEA